MQIRPRSALLHHQASLPPVSTSLLRPGSSQSTRRRAGQSGGRTSLTRSKSALGYRKNFRGPGAVSVEATTHGGGGRSLEANLSSALNMSATGSSSSSSSSNNSRGTKNALAQSAAKMQAAHLSGHSSAPPSTFTGNTTTNLAQVLRPLSSMPDSGNTTEASSDSEEDRNTARSTEDMPFGDSVSSVIPSTGALLPATTVAHSIKHPLAGTNGAGSTPGSTLGSTPGPTPGPTPGSTPGPTPGPTRTVAVTLSNPAQHSGKPLAHVSLVASVGASSSSSSMRASSRNAPRPMTTSSHNPESRRRRSRGGSMGNNNSAGNLHNRYGGNVDPQNFAMANIQANNRRPGTAPERNHAGSGGRNLGSGIGVIGNAGRSGGGNMSQEDMVRENSALRQQLERMRLESFNKIRGGKRFVSGGGFRASRNSEEPSSSVGRNQKNNSSEIQHLKNTIRQLQADKQNAVSELSDANIRLNRCIQNQKQLFQQVKSVETERDRLAETIGVRERLIADQSHRLDERDKSLEMSLGKQRTQADEIIQLQAQLRRLSEESLQGSPERGRSSDLAEITRLKVELERVTNMLTLSNESLIKYQNELIQKSLTLKDKEEELSKTNIKLVETRQEKKDAELAREQSQKELEKSTLELKHTMSTVVSLKETNADLIRSNREKDEEIKRLKALNGDKSEMMVLQQRLKQMETKRDTAEKKYRSELQKLMTQISQLEEEAGRTKMQLLTAELAQKASEESAQQLKATCATLQDELAKLRERVKELEALLATKDKELNRLRNLHKDGKSKTGDLQNDMDTLKRQLTAAKAEVKAVRNQYDEQLQRARDAEMQTRTTKKALSMTETELKRSEQDLTSEQEISEKLREQLAEMAKRLAGTKQLIEEAKHKARKEALESSLQSMVRLCVVAPTVNVHFNSEQQQCKAPMPSSRIQNIIENEVLPNFSELFIQLEEGTAQNGDRLDSWLEGMLGEMRKKYSKSFGRCVPRAEQKQ